MSKSLVRLVDEAIFPAFLIIGLKVLSIGFINDIFSLRFQSQSLTHIYYYKEVNILAINSYSDLVTYVGILIILIFIIIKLLYFTDSKTTPNILLHLARLNKVGFIKTSIETYHIIFIWMMFFTGLNIYLVIRAFSGIIFMWIGVVALIIYLTIFWVLIREVEQDIVKKIEHSRKALF